MRSSACAVGRARAGQLADLVRVKGLLQVEHAARGRHLAGDLLRVDVRVGGDHDDVHPLIEFADAHRGPQPVRAGRHAHVEEDHAEQPVLDDAVLDRGHRLLGAGAEVQFKPFARGLDRGLGRAEQACAHLVQVAARTLRFRAPGGEDVAVAVADGGLVVGHQDADGGHGGGVGGRGHASVSGVDALWSTSGSSRCTQAPRPGPSLVA